MFIVTEKKVDGTVNSDFSFNKKPEVSLIYNLKVLAWYFKGAEATCVEVASEMKNALD